MLIRGWEGLLRYSQIHHRRRLTAARLARAAARRWLPVLLAGVSWTGAAPAQDTSPNPFAQYVNLQANGLVLSPVPATGLPGSVERAAMNGRDLIKFTLRPTDAPLSGHRAELVLPYQPFGVTTSYKFQYMIPEDWVDEVGGKQLFFQMHGADGDPEDIAARSPCFAFQIRTDQVVISTRHDTEPATEQNPTDTVVGGWPIEKGKLVNVELIAKWAYGPGGTTQVLKDGALVYSGTGPNCYNDSQGPYPKIGLYHWEPFPVYITNQTFYTTDVQIRQVDGSTSPPP
jgi:hypothetical protein